MSETLTFNVPTALMPSLTAAELAGDSLRWQCATVKTLQEAEESLDLAETDGYEERQLLIRAPGVFVVRWR